MEPNKNHENDNLESQNNDYYSEEYKSKSPESSGNKEDGRDYASPDKYLAMEQQGVTFTPEKNPVRNSDYIEDGQDPNDTDDIWDAGHKNSRNSQAFNQDDYILKDNINLDEDQSQSLSSEDDIDTNTTDEI